METVSTPGVADIETHFDAIFCFVSYKLWSKRVPGKHYIAGVLLETDRMCGARLLCPRDPESAELNACKFAARMKLLVRLLRHLKRRSSKSRRPRVQVLKNCVTVEPGWTWTPKRLAQYRAKGDGKGKVTVAVRV